MGRIHKLTDELANQIAAGEVVERPSSVVKELVENALDAGASRVVVDVEQGGTKLVRVSDDGEGMGADDALLCLERHATSKIERFGDLSDLGTFGFRGEALPSIASVSRLSLTTRQRGEGEGVQVLVDGGGAPRVAPTGSAVGTTIEVHDLFFNVPARRKFLKATATESAHVSDVLLGMALARHDVTFVLTRDGRTVREHLRVGSRADRARGAMGADGASLALCRAERGPIRIEAMLAPPERARSGATGLSVLINGRPVRDRQLVRAVAQAYGSVLEPGRYPLGVVWVDLPPAMVDVNVHPQKAEVRFSDARGLFDAVTRELHGALARSFGLPALGAHPQAPVVRPEARPDAAATTTRSAGATPREVIATGKSAPEMFALPAQVERTLFPEGNLFARVSEATADSARHARYGALRFVGQVKRTFLVCEGDDALYVLDQHAAAERVTFDRLRKGFAARGVATQRMLVPEIVELSPSEVAMLEEHADEVSRLGIELRTIGESAVAVHGVPDLLVRAEPARLVRDLLAEASRSAGRPFRGALDLVLATIACHGSIRAGDAISEKEVAALLCALDAVDFAAHCPHGRPLVVRMAWSELERKVGR